MGDTAINGASSAAAFGNVDLSNGSVDAAAAASRAAKICRRAAVREARRKRHAARRPGRAAGFHAANADAVRVNRIRKSQKKCVDAAERRAAAHAELDGIRRLVRRGIRVRMATHPRGRDDVRLRQE